MLQSKKKFVARYSTIFIDTPRSICIYPPVVVYSAADGHSSFEYCHVRAIRSN